MISGDLVQLLLAHQTAPLYYNSTDSSLSVALVKAIAEIKELCHNVLEFFGAGKCRF